MNRTKIFANNAQGGIFTTKLALPDLYPASKQKHPGKRSAEGALVEQD